MYGTSSLHSAGAYGNGEVSEAVFYSNASRWIAVKEGSYMEALQKQEAFWGHSDSVQLLRTWEFQF